MICGWTTLTSQCPLQNDHKRQQICQIRHENCLVVHSVFQVCLFYASQSCGRAWEPIKLHYFSNVWSNRFSFHVYFCANGSKNECSTWFFIFWKTTHFFHALFGRSPTFYGHFPADTVTSESSTHILSSHCLYSWYNN